MQTEEGYSGAGGVLCLLPPDLSGFAGEDTGFVLWPRMESVGGKEENSDQRLIYFYSSFLLVSEMMLKILNLAR